jgi:mono/diheme cytochrome c family protein
LKFNLTVAAASLLAVSLATPAFAQTSGADVYKKCQGCHGATGAGNAGMKIASFKSPAVVKESDAALTATIKNGGGAGPIKMPAYAGKLSDDQIKAVVGYIRTLQK